MPMWDIRDADIERWDGRRPSWWKRRLACIILHGPRWLDRMMCNLRNPFCGYHKKACRVMAEDALWKLSQNHKNVYELEVAKLPAPDQVSTATSNERGENQLEDEPLEQVSRQYLSGGSGCSRMPTIRP